MIEITTDKNNRDLKMKSTTTDKNIIDDTVSKSKEEKIKIVAAPTECKLDDRIFTSRLYKISESEYRDGDYKVINTVTGLCEYYRSWNDYIYTNLKLKEEHQIKNNLLERDLSSFADRFFSEKWTDPRSKFKENFRKFKENVDRELIIDNYKDYTLYNLKLADLLSGKYQIESLSIDGEWFTKHMRKFFKKIGKPSKFISKQATFNCGKNTFHVVAVSEDFPEFSPEAFLFLNHPIILYRGDIQDISLMNIIRDIGVQFKMKKGSKGKSIQTKIPCYMYYAFNDIRCIAHPEIIKYQLQGFLPARLLHRYKDPHNIKSHFEKKRNINGEIPLNLCFVTNEDLEAQDYDFDLFTPPKTIATEGLFVEDDETEMDDYDKVTIVIKDLIGAFNSSLDKAFDLVGMDNITKDIVDAKRKGNMDEVAKEDMDLFLIYLLGDTMYLKDLWKNRVNQINNIVEKSLGFNPSYELDDCPRTSGALVSDVWMKWLEHKHPLLLAAVETLATPYQTKEWVFEQYLEVLASQKDNVLKGYVELYPTPKAKEPKKIKLSELHKLWNDRNHKLGESLSGISGMAVASIGAFAGLGSKNGDATMFNSLVIGGRCYNENPTLWKMMEVFDIDLSSCYGSSLNMLDYPLGKPTLVDGVVGDESGLTWKKYSDKYLSENRRDMYGNYIVNQNSFSEGLWSAVISNPIDKKTGERIPFKHVVNDLIPGKPDATTISISNDVINNFNQDDGDYNEIISTGSLTYSIEKSHISAPLLYAKKEIHNGVVTSHDLPKIVNNIASKNEKSELNKMRVITAVGYKNSDEVQDGVTGEYYVSGYKDGEYLTTASISKEEKFFDLLANSATRGEYKQKAKTNDGRTTNTNFDGRTNAWFRLPMSEFIGKFLSYRKMLKGKKKYYANGGEILPEDLLKSNDNEKLSKLYDVEQEAVKLFVNTLYGCLASPFFPLSNTILANNITAKARFGVWMVSKALGTIMSITDGGAYRNSHVRFLKPENDRNRKPSLSVLADAKKLDAHRSIEVGKLVDSFDSFYRRCKEKPTSNIYLHNRLDRLATEHINNFWSNYGLKLEFEIEHKANNTAKEAVVWNKSDYMFINPIKPSKKALIIDGNVVDINSPNNPFLADTGLEIYYTPKVRGAKQDFHIKKLMLFFLAGLIKLEDKDLNFEFESLIGLSQFIAAINGNNPEIKDWTEDMFPGETLIEVARLFNTTNHFPKDLYQDIKNEQRRLTDWKNKLDVDFLLRHSRTPEGYLDEEIFSKILQKGGDEFLSSLKIVNKQKNTLRDVDKIKHKIRMA